MVQQQQNAITATSQAPLSTPRPPLVLLLAVAVLSAAVLGIEVAFTRILIVLTLYHYSFLIISVALCGLGFGGYLACWLRQSRPISLPLFALIFGASIPCVLLLILRVFFVYAPDAHWLPAVLLLVPFTSAGVFLAEVFTRYPVASGRLYAWDLAGAALAALGIIGLLQFVSAINAVLLLSALAVLAGVLAAGGFALRSPLRALTGAGCIILGVLFAVGLRWPLFEIPTQAAARAGTTLSVGKPLFTSLNDPVQQNRIVDTRWNAFTRTDVVQNLDHSYYMLYTNGGVPTHMMRWDGTPRGLQPIAEFCTPVDWVFANAPLGQAHAKRGDVLSIGPGGGIDVLMALHHGAAHIEGAEINPSMLRIMDDYRAFNGNLYRHPNVRISVADGRSFVREKRAQGKRYAVIYSALTKSSSVGQGMLLLESYIHTQNAMRDYLQILQDDGQLVLIVDRKELMARFFTTAVAALQQNGLNEREACRRIAVVMEPNDQVYHFILVVQKSPISIAQAQMMRDTARDHAMQPIWIPGLEIQSQYFTDMAAGKITLADFVQTFRDKASSVDVSPCPDDRPFVLDTTFGVPPVFVPLAVLAAVLALILAMFGWQTVRTHTRMTGNDLVFLLYFFALGVGFMLVEIPLMQKLILPLGYPTLALTVILFSLLLGGGVGSWFSQRFSGPALQRWAAIMALGVAAMTVIAIILFPALSDQFMLLAIVPRCLFAAGVCLPLGFMLGTPFPSGIRLFAATRAELVPLVWGMNGVASVVGSLCAAMGAKLIGFNGVLLCGAAVYVLAMLLLIRLKRDSLPA